MVRVIHIADHNSQNGVTDFFLGFVVKKSSRGIAFVSHLLAKHVAVTIDTKTLPPGERFAASSRAKTVVGPREYGFLLSPL